MVWVKLNWKKEGINGQIGARNKFLASIRGERCVSHVHVDVWKIIAFSGCRLWAYEIQIGLVVFTDINLVYPSCLLNSRAMCCALHM
ncbi:hypothetical protein K2173_000682 [Erythroxylum novogranatense]|uniref:Uncharacterized protein n=1 Tax=Erythroxylum novogranatense TaxID=1862640 RepID=A0AAV8SIW9_9ROSI|nr:hypothetical protein K2173_000682 [Erythroxylum novogranatense]